LGKGAEGIIPPDTVLRVRIMSELERRVHYAAGALCGGEIGAGGTTGLQSLKDVGPRKEEVR